MQDQPNEVEHLSLPARKVGGDAPDTTGGNLRHQVLTDPPDVVTEQLMRLAELSGALSFWERDEEDVYTLDDGQPL